MGTDSVTMRRPAPLRIALIADPYLPVPPTTYGGIERVIAMLVSGLVGRGHRVTLFAAPGSVVDCELVTYGAPPHFSLVARLRELLQVASGLALRARGFDVVHSFGRLAALLPILGRPLPKLQSYQREITRRSIERGVRWSGGSLLFTSCSTSLRRGVSDLGRWETVYNGAPAERFHFAPRVADDAPLVFLGRVERIKGAHTAIEVARLANRRLLIAGNIPDGHRAYFEAEIAPHVDGDRVRYAGPVDDAEKDRLLGQAAALLMPVEWEEPFGIVMAEALACGTPVIGLARGAVPEVVESGSSGFVCRSLAEMVEAVGSVNSIDRRACRDRYESEFSDDAIVDAYERLYVREVARCTAGGGDG
jgi:glycosyltransferase involved in cell wall biosynthesis